MTELTVHEIKGEAEILAEFDLILQINPEITKEKFQKILPKMLHGGYRLVGVFNKDKCVGIGGFWIRHAIWCAGAFLQPDNLVVDKKYRGQGIGKMMLDWFEDEAKRNGCKLVALESYAANHKSHAFYMREKFHIRGFFFCKFLNEENGGK